MEVKQQFEEALEACRDQTDFQGLRDLMADATPHLGFWGSRYITVKGCGGALHLDHVPVVLLQIGLRELSWKQEKVVGELSSRISDVYLWYDHILRTSNIFSRFLGIVREVFDFTYRSESTFGTIKTFSRKKWMQNTTSKWKPDTVRCICPHSDEIDKWGGPAPLFKALTFRITDILSLVNF